MMPRLFLPALAALAVGVPATGPHRRLHPSVGARALAVATIALALAMLSAVATVAVGFISSVPWVADNVSWCRSFSRSHGEVPEWLGVPAAAVLAAMILAAARAYRGAARTLWQRPTSNPLVRVIDDARPEAYAIGGNPGQVVVSAGMLRLLEPMERQVLMAHERSHLRHRHHRYIALALVATAAVPVLGFVTRRLRLAVERWADEDAAAEVGDRRLVARTIIRAALARTEFEGDGRRLGLGVLGVRARVDALLLPPPSSLCGPAPAIFAAAVATVTVLGGSALQVHHLFAFFSHVCNL